MPLFKSLQNTELFTKCGMLRWIEVSADDSDSKAGLNASQQMIAVADPKGRQVCSLREKFCKIIGSPTPWKVGALLGNPGSATGFGRRNNLFGTGSVFKQLSLWSCFLLWSYICLLFTCFFFVYMFLFICLRIPLRHQHMTPCWRHHGVTPCTYWCMPFWRHPVFDASVLARGRRWLGCHCCS